MHNADAESQGELINGRYQLLARIGAGGMGVVYRALDRLTGVEVALKRIALQRSGSSDQGSWEPAPPATDPIAQTQPGSPTAAGDPSTPQTHSDDAAEAALAGTLATGAQLPGRLAPSGHGLAHSPPMPFSATAAELPGLAATAAELPGLAATAAALPIAAGVPGTDRQAATDPATREPIAVDVRGATVQRRPGKTARNQSPEQVSQLSAELRLALAHEFRTLASFRHPNIISVLDYGFDAARNPYYTMELLRESHTLLEATAHASLKDKIHVLLQLLQALTYLHRRGVLHRDIKPQNALTTGGPLGTQVKLVDFGLAVLREQLVQESASIAGTLAYIAPEILQGALPSEASDLYAVGVMAYELLNRRLPFAQQQLGDLISAVLKDAPDLSSPQLPPPIADVLRRLLEKDPAQRLASAEAAIQALCAAAEIAVPQETTSLRESFLHAARFVGRETEMTELRRALSDLVAGKGQGLLLGGESGVGKSRLLDELRAEALVKGSQVLRGHAIHEGGGAYRVWRDILLSLCLLVPPSPFQASVLQPLVPQLEQVLGVDIPAPPPLDAQAANLRLLRTVEELLLAAHQPLLILLEDMHWADPESLALLQRIAAHLTSRPILVIASYRDDERPDLPSQLSRLRHQKLARLRPPSIADLSDAILGPAGRRPDLIDLLQKETEGNAFFVVEVVRALAEEAGRLSAVGQGGVPAKIVSGGIKAVLDRRIHYIPSSGQRLLQQAALLGRQLDPQVLARLHADVDGWLQGCANAAVLEISDGRWQFAHDKLRERVLERLAAEDRLALHGEVALAIEQVYPDDPLHSAALAYHFGQAGQSEKTLHYAALAGSTALKQGALQAAATLLGEASALQERLGVPLAERARVRYGLAHALHGLGRMSESIPLLEEALEQRGHPVPRRPLRLGLGLAATLFGLTLRRFRRPSAPPTAPSPTDLEESFATGMALGDCYTAQGQVLQMLNLSLQGLNYSEVYQLKDIMAFYYAGISVTLPYTPLWRWAEYYHHKAETLFAPEQRHELDQGAPTWVQYCYLLLGVAHTAEGSWAKARQLLTRARELARASAHEQLEARTMGALLQVWHPAGDFQIIMDTAPRMYQLAERALSKFCIYSQATRAHIHIRRNELKAAGERLEDAKKFCNPNDDALFHINITAPESLYAVRQGSEQCHALTERCAELIDKCYLSPFLVEDYGALAEALFDLWLRESGPTAAATQRRFRRLLRRLQACGSRFTRARAKALMWQGLYDWQQGQPDLARKGLTAAVAWAEKMEQPFDQALAELWLGRLARQGELGREAEALAVPTLQAAWRRFAEPRLATTYYVERIQAALRGEALRRPGW